jgi:hypothetical protein
MYPSATLSTTWPDLGSNPGRCSGKPATNCLRYGTAFLAWLFFYSQSEGWSPYWVHSARRSLNDLFVPALGDCDDGVFGGMKIGKGNWSTWRKRTPAPLCPPQIPLDQTRARTQTAAVGSQRLTAWGLSSLAYSSTKAEGDTFVRNEIELDGFVTQRICSS